jgi:signal peptide peptidase SppA
MNFKLLSRILSQPWAVRREQLTLFTQLVISPEGASARMQSEQIQGAPRTRITGATREHYNWHTGEWITAEATAGYVPLSEAAWDAAEGSALPPVPDGVTVLLIWGILGRGWTELEKWWLDAIDVDDITAAIEATPEGSTVVLWVRSPGGIVTGIPETAAFLRKIQKSRRVLVFSDDLCASAAYWLASQAERIDASPTAELGSIGVYLAFYDFCEYLKKAGISLQLWKAGSMKGLGVPGNPVNDAQSQHLQAGVDECYRQFTGDVKRNRAISSATMQGQTYSGAEAQSRVLVDAFYPSSSAYFLALGKGKISPPI